MKRVAEEYKAIVRIPLVAGIAVVVVEPTLAVIAIHVEQSRVPVQVVLCGESSVSLPFENATWALPFF